MHMTKKHKDKDITENDITEASKIEASKTKALKTEASLTQGLLTEVLSTSESLSELCEEIHVLVTQHNYSLGQLKIVEAMARYPHSPIPHNLMGILLERQKNHLLALKHFRAAYALDPTYWPVQYNMDQYANLRPISHLVYSDIDREGSRPNVGSL